MAKGSGMYTKINKVKYDSAQSANWGILNLLPDFTQSTKSILNYELCLLSATKQLK